MHGETALEALRCEVAARPGDADAHVRLGNGLFEAGEPAAALDCYRAALALRPHHGPTHYNLGNAHLRLGEPVAAAACFRVALRLQPDSAGSHNNLGNALRGQLRLTEAAACYRAALALAPDSVGTHTNLAATLIALRQPAEAMTLLLQATRIDPNNAEVCNNLGGALLALDRLEEALAWFERALALAPGLVQAEFGMALALLALGRLREGWERYEARWRDPGFTADETVRATPVWDGGGDPAGLTILLHAEQGFGDTIQFVRYAPMLRVRGARVVLEVQPGLVELCRPLADTVIAAGTPSPPHDLRCPLLSLPRAFDTTLECVPAGAGYLSVPADAGVRGPGCNIGAVFSGAAEHPEDDLRSVPANLWWRVLRLPATFHLLQPLLRDPDAAALAFMPALRRHDLADFAATARLVAALDVVVSVDTAVAHLAAALGRPVLLLLQHSADFRWLRERDDSPWYPTIRLFRRGANEDWPEVLGRVAAALLPYVQPPSTTKA